MIRCCDSTYWMSRTTLGKRRRLTRQESTPLTMLDPNALAPANHSSFFSHVEFGDSSLLPPLRHLTLDSLNRPGSGIWEHHEFRCAPVVLQGVISLTHPEETSEMTPPGWI